MKKNWVLRLFAIGVLLAVAFFLTKNFITMSYKQNNFPVDKKWSIRLGAQVVGISLIDEQIIMARTTSALYALAINSGDILWRKNLAWQVDPKPAIANNGIVYIADSSSLFALSQENGSTIWEQHVTDASAWVVGVSNDIVVAEFGGYFIAFDAIEGNMLWKVSDCRGYYAKAFITKTNVYFPCSGIKAVDIQTGKILWQETFDEGIGYVGYGNGVMYYSNESYVTAFDLQNRVKLWQAPVQINGIERLEVINEILFFADSTHLCALQRTDGDIVWCTDVIPYPQNPTLLGTIVYIFNGKQDVITALKIKTGEEIGSLEFNSFKIFTIYRQLMVSANDLLVFSNGREVSAFGH